MPHTPRTPSEQEVLVAAHAIVDAFRTTNTERYFAGFAPDASFIFHPEPSRLNTRAEYEKLWASWLAGGWRVIACDSSEPLVQVFPGGAVFSHTVHTTVFTGEAEDSYWERESIIFRIEGDGLVGVHEHLSAFTSEG